MYVHCGVCGLVTSVTVGKFEHARSNVILRTSFGEGRMRQVVVGEGGGGEMEGRGRRGGGGGNRLDISCLFTACCTLPVTDQQ